MTTALENYQIYLKRIEELKSVKLEDTGLFLKNQDEALWCLKDNYIYTVGDLLEKTSPLKKGHVNVLKQITGIRNLLLYKYLGEDLPLTGILDRNINFENVYSYTILGLGLSQNFWRNCRNFPYNSDESIIDYFKRIKKAKNESLKWCDEEDFNKIKLIVKWYDSKFSKYSELEHINLEDTGIITPGKKKDAVYVKLKNNDITNLQELFLAADDNSINYGTNAYNNGVYQTKGTIKLLRYKYLGEDLPFLNVLDGEVIKQGSTYIKCSDAEKPLEITACEYLCHLGLSFQFACDLQSHMRTNDIVIQFLENFMNNRNGFYIRCSKMEYERNIEKLKIIIGWYNLRNNNVAYLEYLHETSSQLLCLKNELNKLYVQRNLIDEQIDDISGKIQKIEECGMILARKNKVEN